MPGYQNKHGTDVATFTDTFSPLISHQQAIPAHSRLITTSEKCLRFPPSSFLHYHYVLLLVITSNIYCYFHVVPQIRQASTFLKLSAQRSSGCVHFHRSMESHVLVDLLLFQSDTAVGRKCEYFLLHGHYECAVE